MIHFKAEHTEQATQTWPREKIRDIQKENVRSLVTRCVHDRNKMRSQSTFVQISHHQSYEAPWLLILVLAAEIWSQDEDIRDQNFWAFGYNLKLETIVPPGPDWKMNTQPWNVMISQWTPSNKSCQIRHCDALLCYN